MNKKEKERRMELGQGIELRLNLTRRRGNEGNKKKNSNYLFFLLFVISRPVIENDNGTVCECVENSLRLKLDTN